MYEWTNKWVSKQANKTSQVGGWGVSEQASKTSQVGWWGVSKQASKTSQVGGWGVSEQVCGWGVSELEKKTCIMVYMVSLTLRYSVFLSRMDEWVKQWTNEWMNERMNERKSKQASEWVGEDLVTEQFGNYIRVVYGVLSCVYSIHRLFTSNRSSSFNVYYSNLTVAQEPHIYAAYNVYYMHVTVLREPYISAITLSLSAPGVTSHI